MTRLISNSTRSSRAASTDGGTCDSRSAGELSIGVLAALLTGLPGRAGPRRPGEAAVDGAARPAPPASVLHRLDPRLGVRAEFAESRLRVFGRDPQPLPERRCDC